MEMFGKTLCVTYDELVGSGIMSKSNYKKHVREKSLFSCKKAATGVRCGLYTKVCLKPYVRIMTQNILTPRNNSKTDSSHE